MQPFKRNLEQELSPIELWNNDPRKKTQVKGLRNWKPIPSRYSRNVEALSKRIFPAIKEEDIIKKINTATLHLWNDSFKKSDPSEEITNLTLVDRCITIHKTGAYWQFFVPSIGEVLIQIPDSIVNSKNEYYFTTQPISDDPKIALIHTDYHIGITEIYQQTINKKKKI